MEARWTAEGRGDVASVSLLPRGRPWYSPAPESRLRLIVVFSVLILAIACFNVSTLIGTTVQTRQKELAIRASLGAGRLGSCDSSWPSTWFSRRSVAWPVDSSAPGWRVVSRR